MVEAARESSSHGGEIAARLSYGAMLCPPTSRTLTASGELSMSQKGLIMQKVGTSLCKIRCNQTRA
jgi:hypothetical protein